MGFTCRLIPSCALLALCCGFAAGGTHEIDGTLPNGGDCPLYGDWDPASSTCRIEDGFVPAGQWLRIDHATVAVVGTLTNEGAVDNRGTIVIDGFFNNVNDLVNFWDGTMVNRGQFFSHFMYNFGGLTNEATGSIELELHIENNAPLINHGSILLHGTLVNITDRRIENVGSLTIAPTGHILNGGIFLHAGQIDNAGLVENDAELILHCESTLAGNPIEGPATSATQSLHLDPTSLQWCPIDGATRYDVVSGDLALLVATGGDFSSATTGCPGSSLTQLSLTHAGNPQSGEAWWFLVRADGTPDAAFDSGFASQVDSRDDEIAASPSACR